MLKELRKKIFGLTDEERQRETMRSTIMDAMETRPKVKREDGTEVEDTKYIHDLIESFNDASESKLEKEKESKWTAVGNFLKGVGAVAVAVASIYATRKSDKFGRDMVSKEEQGAVIPKNRMSYRKEVDRPR